MDVCPRMFGAAGPSRFARRAFGLGLLALLVGCADHSMGAAGGVPSDERAVALIEQRCSTCHATDRIYSSSGNEEEWHAVVHRMVYHHKAKLLSHVSDQEAHEIARWLAEKQTPARGGIHVGFVPSGRPL